jgi:hypothetical protein
LTTSGEPTDPSLSTSSYGPSLSTSSYGPSLSRPPGVTPRSPGTPSGNGVGASTRTSADATPLDPAASRTVTATGSLPGASNACAVVAAASFFAVPSPNDHSSETVPPSWDALATSATRRP